MNKLKFKEVNNIIDYLINKGYIIDAFSFDNRTIDVLNDTGKYSWNRKRVYYQIYWETNGEYYYEII